MKLFEYLFSLTCPWILKISLQFFGKYRHSKLSLTKQSNKENKITPRSNIINRNDRLTISDIYLSKNTVAWSVNETHLPHEFPKIFRAVKSKDGQGWKRRRRWIEDRRGAFFERRPTFRIETFLCEETVGRMGDPRNGGGGGPREGWQRRREEKKRAIRLERAA